MRGCSILFLFCVVVPQAAAGCGKSRLVQPLDDAGGSTESRDAAVVDAEVVDEPCDGIPTGDGIRCISGGAFDLPLWSTFEGLDGPATPLTVSVARFGMDESEVSNRAFFAFSRAEGVSPPADCGWNSPAFPHRAPLVGIPREVLAQASGWTDGEPSDALLDAPRGLRDAARGGALLRMGRWASADRHRVVSGKQGPASGPSTVSLGERAANRRHRL